MHDYNNLAKFIKSSIPTTYMWYTYINKPQKLME